MGCGSSVLAPTHPPGFEACEPQGATGSSTGMRAPDSGKAPTNGIQPQDISADSQADASHDTSKCHPACSSEPSGDLMPTSPVNQQDATLTATCDAVDKANAAVCTVDQVVANMPEQYKNEYRNLFEVGISSGLSGEDLEKVAADVQAGIRDNIDSDGLLLLAGGALNREALLILNKGIEGVGKILSVVAPHLGPMAAVVGSLGAVAIAFKESIHDDEHVRKFLVWASGLKDYLMLVARHIDRSNGDSTQRLFDELNYQLKWIIELIQTRSKQNRLCKMICGNPFRKQFADTEEHINNLKMQLKDYLSQKAQDAFEEKLTQMHGAHLKAVLAITEQQEQNKVIHQQNYDKIITSQEELRKKLDAMLENSSSTYCVDVELSEEEKMFAILKKLSGVDGAEIPFHIFIQAFEEHVCGGEPIWNATRRALHYAMDKDGNNAVSKPEFIQFWRRWRQRQISMEDFLLELCDQAPPTAMELATEKYNALVSTASATKVKVLEMAASAKSIAKSKCSTSYLSTTLSSQGGDSQPCMASMSSAKNRVMEAAAMCQSSWKMSRTL